MNYLYKFAEDESLAREREREESVRVTRACGHAANAMAIVYLLMGCVLAKYECEASIVCSFSTCLVYLFAYFIQVVLEHVRISPGIRRCSFFDFF